MLPPEVVAPLSGLAEDLGLDFAQRRRTRWSRASSPDAGPQRGRLLRLHEMRRTV